MEEKVSAVVVKNLLEAEMEDIFIGKVRVCGVENFGGVGVVWCGVVAKFKRGSVEVNWESLNFKLNRVSLSSSSLRVEYWRG